MTSPTLTLRIVLVGNPGVGKSTLLNTLIGRATFASGISIGSGLTQLTQVHTVNSVEYVDTPGLDDVIQRNEAASEISTALSTSLPTKLIFVITLESGVLKPADLATIDSVAEAMERGGACMAGGFAVILNKCSSEEIRMLEEGGREALMGRLGRRWGPVKLMSIGLVAEASGRSDVLLTGMDVLRQFVLDAPVVVGSGRVVVEVADYDAVKRKLEEEVSRLRRRVAEEKKKEGRKRMFIVIFGVAVLLGIVFWAASE